MYQYGISNSQTIILKSYGYFIKKTRDTFLLRRLKNMEYIINKCTCENQLQLIIILEVTN